jgi:hypothetical protein
VTVKGLGVRSDQQGRRARWREPRRLWRLRPSRLGGLDLNDCQVPSHANLLALSPPSHVRPLRAGVAGKRLVAEQLPVAVRAAIELTAIARHDHLLRLVSALRMGCGQGQRGRSRWRTPGSGCCEHRHSMRCRAASWFAMNRTCRQAGRPPRRDSPPSQSLPRGRVRRIRRVQTVTARPARRIIMPRAPVSPARVDGCYVVATARSLPETLAIKP